MKMRNATMKKKKGSLLSRLFVCLLGAVLLSAALPAQAKAEEAALPVSEPLCVYGTIHREGERILLTGVNGDTNLDELVLNISEETRILDAVNGFPVAEESLAEGEVVYAYISQAMALSLPPQSHASLILCQIPADFGAPLFETAFRLTALDASSFLLTTVRGNEYIIDGSTVLLPYLTRNMVTAADLTAGRTFLVWTNGITGQSQSGTAQMRAAKIVMFAPARSEAPSGPASDPELTDKIQLN